MSREERWLKGGWTPNIISQWEQTIRLMADKLAQEELDRLVNLRNLWMQAVQQGKGKEVERLEIELVELFDEEIEQLNAMYGSSLRLEWHVIQKLKQVVNHLSRIRSKSAQAAAKPEIAQFEKQLKELTSGTKNMAERAGDLVQGIQMRNINLYESVGAERSLLTPLVLYGRQQRKLTSVVEDYSKSIVALAQQVEAAAGQKNEIDLVAKLRHEIAEMDKQLKDEIQALIQIRLNTLYVIMAVHHHMNQEVQKLKKLLQAGFSQSVEQSLEARFAKLAKKLDDIEKRFMWLEQATLKEAETLSRMGEQTEYEYSKAA